MDRIVVSGRKGDILIAFGGKIQIFDHDLNGLKATVFPENILGRLTNGLGILQGDLHCLFLICRLFKQSIGQLCNAVTHLHF